MKEGENTLVNEKNWKIYTQENG